MVQTPLSQIARLIRLAALSLPLACIACAQPSLQNPGHKQITSRLAPTAAIMDDGYRLPLRSWRNADSARAMVLAIHGFNDYSNAFAALGSHLERRGILTYAYDQRGFGATVQRGHWAGTDRMLQDLRQIVRLLRLRHPDLPLYLLGESMGGALLIAAASRGLTADGFVLIAPAVWSRDRMNPLLRLALWIGAHTLPGLELTGEGVDIRPSDNLPMLRECSTDPLVIKATRIDALWGVVNLMDEAKASSGGLRGLLLLLYGEHDDIIPPDAYCDLLHELPRPTPRTRLVLYRDGWHMLTRDLQGKRVIDDIFAWLTDTGGPLPSSEEIHLDSERFRSFCGLDHPRNGS